MTKKKRKMSLPGHDAALEGIQGEMTKKVFRNFRRRIGNILLND